MKDPPAGTLLGPVAGATMAPQLRSWFTQFVEQALDPFADGRMSFDLALPPAFTRVIDQRLLDVESIAQARCVRRRGEELGAAQIEIAFAWPFLR